MKHMIMTSILAAYAVTGLSAQELDTNPKPMTLKRAELIVPRANIKGPVKSLIPSEQAMSVDTLDTGNPAIKIVLYGDNTWKYVKDGNLLKNNDYFTGNWNEAADAYKLDFEKLPEKTTLWLVDENSQFCTPVTGNVYSKFGYRRGRRHQGVDIPLKIGDPVRATFDGKVRVSRYYKGYGNYIILRHENGLETFYCHLSKRNCEEGEWVTAGTVIGLGGSTGRSTGPHLHFETRYMGYAFDPQWLIDFPTGTLRNGVFNLKKKYLSVSSRYVPESDEEEEDILKAEDEERAEAARKAAEEAAIKYHTVKSGETLYSISRKYHTTVTQLCKWNNMTTKSTLKIGRKLRVH